MIDTAPLLSKAHVTCARCGAAYEALLVDGLVETTLPAEQTEAQPIELAAAQLETETCQLVESDEVLALPQAVEKVEPKDEPATVLEILEPARPELLIEPEPTATHVLTGNPSAASTPDEPTADTLDDSGAFVMPADYEPQFSRVEIER
ncbi:MAG TPA: hypothetical protein VE775_11675, partial [Pyrinomonadaceae bacterium]|nr:hypothetical protein [Pyrinomonadaceae bacterium]